MRLTSGLLAAALLVSTSQFCLSAEPEVPTPDNRLAELAAEFNSMFVRGKALACVIGSPENSGTTTVYNTTPYMREPDGSYASQTSWSVVTSRKGQPPTYQYSKQTERLQWEGNKPVSVAAGENYTGRPQDIIQGGNGITYRIRNPVQGDISETDYIRRGDGSVVGIQRYLGLTAVVLWEEVPVPPDLQRGPAQQISSRIFFDNLTMLR